MNKKILIVDDEVDVIKVLSARLQERGFLVDTALNGESALKSINRNVPDLIILDIMMPGLSGDQVAAQLKQDKKTSSIPIIFLSALLSKKEERLKGENIILAKPYDIDVLVSLIHEKLK